MKNIPTADDDRSNGIAKAPNSMKRLCSLHEVKPNRPNLFHIKRKGFLVVRNGDTVHVTGHTCTHAAGSLIDGAIVGNEIVCPLHHARFSLIDGKVMTPPALDGIDIFDSAIIAGDVYVGRPKGSMETPVREPTSRNPTTALHIGETTLKVLVIGAGPAGLNCAEHLRTLGFVGDITILSDESDAPYDRTLLTKDALQDGNTATLTPLRDPAYLQYLDIKILTGTRVTFIDRIRRAVITQSNKSYEYNFLVVATGRDAVKPPFSFEEEDPVFTLRTQSNLVRFESRLRRLETERAEPGNPPKIAIVGMGFLGLEAAATLRSRNFAVSLIAPEASPLVSIFGAELASRIYDVHRKAGVEFYPHTLVKSFAANEGILGLSDGRRISADAVLVAIGSTPNSSLLAKAGLCLPGQPVPVDERFRTADSHIFAAGDVTLSRFLPLQARSPSEHWSGAAHQGRGVARSITGVPGDETYIPFFWSQQYEWLLQSVGMPRDDAERTVLIDGPGARVLVSYTLNGSVFAFAGIGVERELIIAETVLQEGIPVTPEAAAKKILLQ